MEEKHSTKINFRSESFKKYFANTGWLMGEKIIRLILATVVNIFVIRYLGPEDFGKLTYALSFVGLFSSFATLGIDTVLVRELVKRPQDESQLLGTTFLLRLTGSLIGIALIIITLQFMNNDAIVNAMILIISVGMIFQSVQIIEPYFQSKVQAKYSVQAQFISLLFSSSVKLLLIYFTAPLIWFAVVQFIEIFVLAIGFLTAYKLNSGNFKLWNFKKETAVQLFKDSAPLLLASIFVSVYMKIDQVMIKQFLDDTAVGLYGTAVRLCEAWYFIPMAVTASLFPAIVNAKLVSEELYKSRLQKLYDLLAFIAIAIAVPVTILSDKIILILFGAEYLPAAPVLTIYIWAGIAVFLGVASSQYLISENLTTISFYRTLIGMIVNVILNIWWIPLYGIQGAAWATLISYSIAALFVGVSKKSFENFIMMLKSLLFIRYFNLFKK